MIFSQKSIQDIIAKRKTQTRRLIKEGDQLISVEPALSKALKDNFRVPFPTQVKKNNKTKWQIGRDYAVQWGRGKPCVKIQYCLTCAKIFDKTKIKTNPKDYAYFTDAYKDKLCPICIFNLSLLEPEKTQVAKKQLRIRITNIRKEKLFDISNEDSKKEGFENPDEFLGTFVRINWSKIPKEKKKNVSEEWLKEQDYSDLALWAYEVGWNPFVWVLDFEMFVCSEKQEKEKKKRKGV